MILDYQTIPLYGKVLFESATIIPPFKMPVVMNDEACFLYVMDGTYSSISPEEKLVISTSESLLMKCGNYMGKMTPAVDAPKYRAVSVHFFPDVLEKVFEHQLPKFLTAKGTRPLSMTKIKSDQVITRYIESVLFYFDNPALVDEEILSLKLREIILLLNQTSNSEKIKTILSNLFNPRTYTFRETIEAHLYSSLSTTELAELCCMSLSTFKREFARSYGLAPATYIMGKKLEKSRELLGLSSQSIAQIAFSSGFNNISHFSKAFKQKYGVSPSDFRLARIAKE